MEYFLLFVLSIVGGVFYRFRGGWPSIPRPIEQMLFCSIFGYLMYAMGLPLVHVVIAYALAVIATLKGHGNNMDLGHEDMEGDPEWYEMLIEGYKGKLSAYWYDVLGVAISGLSITAIVGLAISFYSPIDGLIIGLSGALKAPAYMIGWAMHPKYDDGFMKMKTGNFVVGSATEWGEFLFGIFAWSVSMYILISL